MFQVLHGGVLADVDKLDAHHIGPVLHLFRGYVVAEDGVVGTAGGDLAPYAGGEAGVGLPHYPRHGQIGHGQDRLDAVDILANEAQTVAHINEADHDGVALLALKHQTGGVLLVHTDAQTVLPSFMPRKTKFPMSGASSSLCWTVSCPMVLLVEGTKTGLPNPNLGLYRKLISRGVPMVFMHNIYPELSDCISVLDDNYGGGRQLVEYLYKKGHRSISGIFKNDDLQGLQRYARYADALREFGLPMEEQRVF